MFIEHIPRAECLQCSYNRRDISADAHRTGGIAFVYGHIQGVGVTAYRIYIIIIVKLKRWGQMLRIIGDSCKKTAETIAMMSVKYINREKTLFPSGHLEA